MKKLLTILLTLLMVFTLVGCNDKKEEPVLVDTPELNEVEIEEESTSQEEGEIVGGFVEVEDRTLTDELKEIFNKAYEGYAGIGFEPQELYATQVVAGTNYKFVCSGTKTTNPPIRGTYFVTVYKDLQGNCSIIDVETITESAGDVDGENPALKTYNYWVVFYNPDGNEIQRKAIKYGTQIEYDGDDPVYWDNDYWYKFVCWTDKKGNEIKEFPKVSGNHYYYAKYEVGGENVVRNTAPPVSGCQLTTPIYCILSNNGGINYYCVEYTYDGESWNGALGDYDLVEGLSAYVCYHFNGTTAIECPDEDSHMLPM